MNLGKLWYDFRHCGWFVVTLTPPALSAAGAHGLTSILCVDMAASYVLTLGSLAMPLDQGGGRMLKASDRTRCLMSSHVTGATRAGLSVRRQETVHYRVRPDVTRRGNANTSAAISEQHRRSLVCGGELRQHRADLGEDLHLAKRGNLLIKRIASCELLATCHRRICRKYRSKQT
jgi:hypothetical protein